MKWGRLLEIVGNESVFSSDILRAGRYDAIDLGRQLSRWSRGGRLVQLRRGLYALAPPYRKTTPHPFLIANRLRRGSYVSLQSALEYHGLIPEHSPNVTSVATGRTEELETPFGVFLYRHIKGEFFIGAERIDLPGGQEAWGAGPEKALLDFAVLAPRAAGADETKFWEEMRLQNLSILNVGRLRELGERMGGRRIGTAVCWIETLIDEEKERAGARTENEGGGERDGERKRDRDREGDEKTAT